MNLELGVIGSILDFRDMNPAESSAEPGDESLAEIVSEWPIASELAHLDDDRFRLGLSDPDGQQALSIFLPEDHDVGVVGTVEAKAKNFNFSQLHFLNVTPVTGLKKLD
jgi:hypothetical protein